MDKDLTQFKVVLIYNNATSNPIYLLGKDFPVVGVPDRLEDVVYSPHSERVKFYGNQVE